MTVWAHTLVRNEEKYIWFSIMSVIDYVDKVMVWDTGSDDKTPEIIRGISREYPKKIVHKKVGKVSSEGLTKASQEMIKETESDWILLLDGDEVWWNESINYATRLVRKKNNLIEAIVQPYFNLIGDIFHHQDEKAGKYNIDGRTGHLTIRLCSKNIPGLHFAKEHGQRGLFDKDGVLIQERSQDKRIYVDRPYLHFTNLQRSSSRQKDAIVPKRAFKYKYELGKSFPLDFYYPEVFFIPRPDFVPSPWIKRSNEYVLRASFLTIPKKLKRKLNIRTKSGY